MPMATVERRKTDWWCTGEKRVLVHPLGQKPQHRDTVTQIVVRGEVFYTCDSCGASVEAAGKAA